MPVYRPDLFSAPIPLLRASPDGAQAVKCSACRDKRPAYRRVSYLTLYHALQATAVRRHRAARRRGRYALTQRPTSPP